VNTRADSVAPERAYLDLFEARREALPGAGRPVVEALRQAGARVLAARGLPNRRVEAWKYSDLRAVLADAPFTLAPAPAEEAKIAPVPGLETYRIVFVNGHITSVDAFDAGVEILPLGGALGDLPVWAEQALGQVNPQPDHALIGLNAALVEDGLLLRFGRNAAPSRPIEIVFLWQGRAKHVGAHLRLLIVAEENAQATLIERHISEDEGARFLTLATELALGPGAQLSHVKLHSDGEGARHVAAILGTLSRDAHYDGFFHSRGAKFSRNEVLLRLEGEGATASLTGTSLLAGARHCDNTTVVQHAAPGAKSRQLFKAAVAGHARGVFQGRVVVAPDAQRTDADQVTRAVLLSERAEMDAKPELEILADDVRCTHGAAIGPLNEDAVFYLGTRGLAESEARRLLVAGFMEEAIERLPLEALKTALRAETESFLFRELGQ
jgi:Fe-S cluster assembly protein SufD